MLRARIYTIAGVTLLLFVGILGLLLFLSDLKALGGRRRNAHESREREGGCWQGQ